MAELVQRDVASMRTAYEQWSAEFFDFGSLVTDQNRGDGRFEPYLRHRRGGHTGTNRAPGRPTSARGSFGGIRASPLIAQ